MSIIVRPSVFHSLNTTKEFKFSTQVTSLKTSDVNFTNMETTFLVILRKLRNT